MPYWELLVFFFIIAVVYSSVGFGGGSSYLALLSLYTIPFIEIRLIALICNVIVVTGGVILFVRNKQVNFKKVIPLVLLSVPAAYVGAVLRIGQQTFFIILGCSLIAASILLWLKTAHLKVAENKSSGSIVKDGAIGGAIGFLSGMVGIGGGIFLSPVLNISKWDTPKKIAATASVFILFNSLSGIAGQLSQLPDDINMYRILLLCIAVLAGGQVGSRLGIVKFNYLLIRRVTAILVFAAGINVLIKHLF